MTTRTSAAQLMQTLKNATQQVKEDDLDSAIVTLKGILELDPEHEISLGMLASIYLQIGMIDLAVELYEKLLKSQPNNPLAQFQLGLAKLKLGDAQAAIDVWQPMLSTDGEFMAHFHSALAHIELNQPTEALALIEEAGHHMPTSHPLYPQMVNLHKSLTGTTN